MQLKKYAIYALVAFMVAGFALPADAKDVKIGYVDFGKVFQEYRKTQDFNKVLEEEAEAKKVERDSLTEMIRKERDELELLSADKKADKQREIDEKLQELQAYDRDARLELRRRRDEMMREIFQEIEEAINKYGEGNGYDYIVNDRMLFFKKDSDDLSVTILDGLNAQY